MAFPWISEVNFDAGDRGTFDSETDTDSKLDFPHYSELARVPGLAMPYRGAYCMRVDLAGGTADAFIQEDVDWDMALAETQWWRFMLWVDPDITMANNDEFAIFKLQSAGPVDEAVIVINFTTASGLRIGVGETAGSQFLPLSTNLWHAVELAATLDDGASNNGTLDLTVDGSAATQVASLDQAAVAQGRLGAMDIDAGTTRGHILFDEVISDDAQIYPPTIRFADTVVLTASGHAFVGPGVVDNVTLLSSATADCALAVYDSDVGNSNDTFNRKAQLRNTAAAGGEIVDPAGMPVRVRRGCYVTLSGTADAGGPQALIKIKSAVAWGSDGAIRNYGNKRMPAPRGV